MMLEAVGSATVSPPKVQDADQQVEQQRQEVETQPQVEEESSQVQSEELLNQIKALTEDGLYSVRFEKDDAVNELVVKIIDHETEEVIRQIPAEELLSLSKHLQDLSGNFVNTFR